MKIAFSEINGPEVSRKIVDDGWFPHDDLELGQPATGSLHFRRTGENSVDLSGTLSVRVIDTCSRCARPVELDVSTDFDYSCIVGEEDARIRPETEVRDEDVYTLYLEEPVIDAGEILREQIYLALPAHVLCRESCKGLCQRCGTDLNTSECSCGPGDSSSPFAVLQRLKDK